jgi:hypothetical protein
MRGTSAIEHTTNAKRFTWFPLGVAMIRAHGAAQIYTLSALRAAIRDGFDARLERALNPMSRNLC